MHHTEISAIETPVSDHHLLLRLRTPLLLDFPDTIGFGDPKELVVRNDRQSEREG